MTSEDKFYFIESSRGNPLLVDSSNYIYSKNNTVNNKTYWRCVKSKSGCAGRATTEGTSIGTSGIHNHLGDVAEVKRRSIEVTACFFHIDDCWSIHETSKHKQRIWALHHSNNSRLDNCRCLNLRNK